MGREIEFMKGPERSAVVFVVVSERKDTRDEIIGVDSIMLKMMCLVDLILEDRF